MSARDIIQAAAGVSGETYIEDVFSTYLYTGNGTSQTITNGIDLAGKGGMVWTKSRSAATNNFLFDTVRGALNELNSNNTEQQASLASSLTAFNSNGFSLESAAGINTNADTYASWTFRKAPKFFDVVTYTGTGSAQTINHNLGIAPGMMIVKCTSTSGSNWPVYHKNITNANRFVNLNTTSQELFDPTMWNGIAPTGSSFTVGSAFYTNGSGETYVAYLFAHDTTTDGLIQCGSYTGNGSATGPTVSLGWEPQYLMIKKASGTGNWQIIDNMRGMPVGSADATLQANLSNAESSVDYVSPTATGFQITSTSSEVNTSTSTYIYMAIRRGPMRTPTDGTKVFSPLALNNATGTKNTTGFPVDLQIQKYRGGTGDNFFIDRLRGFSTNGTGSGVRLISNSTAAEGSASTLALYFDNTGFQTASGWDATSVGYQNFCRAPGFFDVVCYTGTGAARTVNHNLGVAPELMIVKDRSVARNWICYNANIGYPNVLILNSTGAAYFDSDVFGSTITSSVFTVRGDSTVNNSADNYVAYLFASCPGVSKVGSYTGTSSTQTISCGFSGGARFVLIKRTDSTGDWYVWDTARGMVAGTDPRLALNSTAAESNANWVYTITGGFQIVTTDASVNANGGSYIFLAVA